MSTKLSTLLKQVNEATKEILSTIHGFDARIAELQAERQTIGQAPVSRADFVGYVEAMVNRLAGNFSGHISRQLEQIDTAFFSMEKSGRAVNFLAPYLRADGVIQEDAAYWYLKPAIMARVREQAAGMDLPEDAMPLTERRAKIAAIDAEIEQIWKQRNELAEQLQKTGMAG